jgi:hypothetical protein
VLIDCDHDESCADEFIGPALMMTAQVMLFHSPRTGRPVQEITAFAQRLKLPVIQMPVPYDVLSSILQEALS